MTLPVYTPIKKVFQYYNSKGQVFIDYGQKWGISVFIIDESGNTLDSWDGKLELMPIRFNKES